MKTQTSLIAQLFLGAGIPVLALVPACVPSGPAKPAAAKESAETVPAPAVEKKEQIALRPAAPAPSPAAATPKAQGPNAPAKPPRSALKELNASRKTGGEDTRVKIEPLPGNAGYHLTGSFHFDATLKPKEAGGNRWVLDGAAKFPSDGYSLGQPVIIPLINMVIGGKDAPGAVAHKSVKQVLMQIPVHSPAAGAAVAVGERTAPLHAEIDGPPDAQFLVSLGGG